MEGKIVEYDHEYVAQSPASGVQIYLSPSHSTVRVKVWKQQTQKYCLTNSRTSLQELEKREHLAMHTNDKFKVKIDQLWSFNFGINVR